MSESAPAAPNSVRDAIRALVTKKQYDLWFSSLTLDSVQDGRVVLTVPDQFSRDWLATYYESTIREATAEVLGVDGTTAVDLVVRPPTSPQGQAGSAPVAARPANETSRSNHHYFLNHSEVLLNPRYTFADFVVGPSNQLAHAAALAVADAPAGSYNPLFVHSSVGLGKTHLLQAICHRAMSANRSMNVLYLSSESFVNQYIAAIEQGDLDRFRFKHRNVDILLIDDIHLLANKERTQDEFFHTFNTLYNAGRQIVLSSDSPPSNIPTLKERLISRFKWGLEAEIAPPGYETRLAILRRKAVDRETVIPEDVLCFLAESIQSNIRELEGAVNKVAGYAQLVHREVNLDLARQALSMGADTATRSVTSTDKVFDMVCAQFNVRRSDLQGRRRTQSIALPRQIAMYLMRRLTLLSLEEIGGHFGGRDHSTVLYAVERIRSRSAGDRSFSLLLAELESRVLK